MTQILILGDTKIGSDIANFIAEHETESNEIFFASPIEQQTSNPFPLNKKINFSGWLTRTESELLAIKFSMNTNFLITCYWPYILPPQCFSGFSGNTLNFHPAYLPRDRGWYPHVHQIANKSISGVTLHRLEAEADCGDIWTQKVVELPFPITAGEARDLLTFEIKELFKSNWLSIKNNSMDPYPQVGTGNYWKKSDVSKLDNLILDSISERLLRQIASRNTGEKSFVYVKTPAGDKYIHLKFSDTGTINEG